VFTNSVQIVIARYSYADYYWDLYLGPYGIKVNPCKPRDNGFRSGVRGSSELMHYERDDIDNPPDPPAVSEFVVCTLEAHMKLTVE